MTRIYLVLSLVLLTLATSLNGDTPQHPLVLVFDTSRSLSETDLEAAVSQASDLLRTLPSENSVGVMVFDNEPRWLLKIGASPGQALEALSSIRPQGQFTLLNDALYTASRSLENGGVILVATDGRDENSATTVEDIARRSASQKVRILSMAVGENPSITNLRRLALVTNGAYLGSVTALHQDLLTAITEATEGVARDIEVERAAKVSLLPPPPEPTLSVESETEPNQDEAPTQGRSFFGLLGLGLVVAISALVALALWMGRRRQKETDVCLHCGTELDDLGVCSRCEGEELWFSLKDRPVADPSETAEVTVDTGMLENLSDGMEKTRVLLHRSLVVVREPGEPTRSMVVPEVSAFSVGRDPSQNTLAIPDPALSSLHFKIVPESGAYFLVDMSSTNGTFHNRLRTKAIRLHNGDVIHAGQVELEFRDYEGLLN